MQFKTMMLLLPPMRKVRKTKKTLSCSGMRRKGIWLAGTKTGPFQKVDGRATHIKEWMERGWTHSLVRISSEEKRVNHTFYFLIHSLYLV